MVTKFLDDMREIYPHPYDWDCPRCHAKLSDDMFRRARHLDCPTCGYRIVLTSKNNEYFDMICALVAIMLLFSLAGYVFYSLVNEIAKRPETVKETIALAFERLLHC